MTNRDEKDRDRRLARLEREDVVRRRVHAAFDKLDAVRGPQPKQKEVTNGE